MAHGDHGRLVQDDALAADEDEGIGGTEVDRQIVRKQAAELLEHLGEACEMGVSGIG